MKLGISSLLTMVLAVETLAATYYVDYGDGDNTNAGTSAGAPWKHCPGDPRASDNAAITLSAGDTVWFQGGETYHFTAGSNDYIQVNASGSSGNLISLRSGHLADPQWGSTRAIVDGTYASYSYSSRIGLIHIPSREYVLVEGLKFQNVYTNAQSNGGAVSFVGASGGNVQISDIVVTNSAANGVYIHGRFGTGSKPSNFQVDNSTISHTYGHGVIIRYGVDDVDILTNDIRWVGTDLGVGGTPAADCITLSYDTSGGGGSIQSNVTIRGNTLGTSEVKGHLLVQEDVANLIFEANTCIETVGVASLLHAGPINGEIIRNNIFNCTASDFEGIIRYRTDQGNVVATDIEIYNNTVVSDSGPLADGLVYFHSGNNTLTNHIRNVAITNNIFDTTQDDKMCVYVGANSAGSGPVVFNLSMDYNLYAWGTETEPFHYTGTNYSFSAWKTLTEFDANSANADLTFADEAGGDFSLEASDTAAIDAGIAISGFGTDYAGNARPSGSAWDIGAYEFDQGDLWPSVPDSPPNRIWIGVP